jgi:hypothetical protein
MRQAYSRQYTVKTSVLVSICTDTRMRSFTVEMCADVTVYHEHNALVLSYTDTSIEVLTVEISIKVTVCPRNQCANMIVHRYKNGSSYH